MSLHNILLMEAELKLAQTPDSVATRAERRMLSREIKRLDAQQPHQKDDSLSEVYKLGQYIVENLR